MKGQETLFHQKTHLESNQNTKTTVQTNRCDRLLDAHSWTTHTDEGYVSVAHALQ